MSLVWLPFSCPRLVPACVEQEDRLSLEERWFGGAELGVHISTVAGYMMAQDLNTEHLVQLVTVPAEPLKVVNASGEGQGALVGKKAVDVDSDCYLPQYFEKHAEEILRSREAGLDSDAACRS
jgi:hypothetical protein